jgi:hypothetical protein
LKLHHTPALSFNRDPPQNDEQRVKKRETTRRKISRKKNKELGKKFNLKIVNVKKEELFS